VDRAAAQAAAQEVEAATAEEARLSALLRETRGRLMERRSASVAEANQNSVVRALMAAQASGKISGIHGRLGAQQQAN
jgi:hypothetical protein